MNAKKMTDYIILCCLSSRSFSFSTLLIPVYTNGPSVNHKASESIRNMGGIFFMDVNISMLAFKIHFINVLFFNLCAVFDKMDQIVFIYLVNEPDIDVKPDLARIM